MFEELTEKLESVFKELRGHGKLSEKNIKEGLRSVRVALLEADVNYRVAKGFIKKVEKRAVGEEVLKSLSPGQMVIKYVHEELVELLGGKAENIKMAANPPTTVMITGLQGSGKTTLCGKLSRFFHKKGKNPMLIAADIYRPAAINQLEIIGEQVGVPVFAMKNEKNALKIVKEGLKEARKLGKDIVFIDTAGRLHIDEGMMQELEDIKSDIEPSEILFVADGMTGQDAVNTAKEFNERLEFDGVVLTKMDGDARGGAALSIREVTGKPIKFMGIGEKMDALEQFHPDRLASRILGMGDVLTLIEKVESQIDMEQAKKMEEKLLKQQFTLEDFLEQLKQVKKMGPLDQLIKMIPGAGKALKGVEIDEKEMDKVEAIINSMTLEERRKPKIIKASRKRRIAKGSGTSVQQVNRLLRDFKEARKMMKKLGKMQKGLGGMGLPF
jgi:signal recognition particle subunit SRP54